MRRAYREQPLHYGDAKGPVQELLSATRFTRIHRGFRVRSMSVRVRRLGAHRAAPVSRFDPFSTMPAPPLISRSTAPPQSGTHLDGVRRHTVESLKGIPTNAALVFISWHKTHPLRWNRAWLRREELLPFQIVLLAQEPAHGAHFQLFVLHDNGFEYVEWMRGSFEARRDRRCLVQHHRVSEPNVQLGCDTRSSHGQRASWSSPRRESPT